MNRRELLVLLSTVMTVGHPLCAERKVMPVIGVLRSGSRDPNPPFAAAFRQGLSEIGYVEGQNVAIEYRWPEGHFDRLSSLAADLVSRNLLVLLDEAETFWAGI